MAHEYTSREQLYQFMVGQTCTASELQKNEECRKNVEKKIMFNLINLINLIIVVSGAIVFCVSME